MWMLSWEWQLDFSILHYHAFTKVTCQIFTLFLVREMETLPQIYQGITLGLTHIVQLLYSADQCCLLKLKLLKMPYIHLLSKLLVLCRGASIPTKEPTH